MEPRNLTLMTRPDWANSPGRDAILVSEYEAATAIVSNIFGYHGLSFSPADFDSELLQQSQTLTNHAFTIDGFGRINGDFIAAADEIPVQDDCSKLLVVQHVHELFDARRYLSELVRILEPAGYLLMLCDRPRFTDLRSMLAVAEPTPSGLYRPRQIRALMQNLGLQHVLTRVIGNPRKSNRLTPLWMQLDRLRYRQYLILFRKEQRHSALIRKQQFAKASLKGQRVASYRTGESP